jgi:hypothetical protein
MGFRGEGIVVKSGQMMPLNICVLRWRITGGMLQTSIGLVLTVERLSARKARAAT